MYNNIIPMEFCHLDLRTHVSAMAVNKEVDATYSVFSPSKIQGMTGGHSLGGACDHNKAHGLSLFPHQREFCTEGLLGRYALGMLGRTLLLHLSY